MGFVDRNFPTNFNFYTKCKINKINFKIPFINGMNCDVTEVWMIEILKTILQRKKGAFIDVGVNVGQTLLKLKSLDPNRQYIGFEPNPSCLYYVENLIQLNSLSDCTIFPFGLYTSDGIAKLEFYNNENTDSSASLIEGFRSNSTKAKYVPVFSFNACSKIINLDTVAIIKIDVEGAELEVVKTLLSTINSTRPIIVLEILPVYDEKNRSRLDRQEELEEIFKRINYSFYRVMKTNNNCNGNLKKIESIGIHSNLDLCDYVIAPCEFDLASVS